MRSKQLIKFFSFFLSQVEKIISTRIRGNKREFLIRWKGFEPADDTWEQEQFLFCPDLIEKFINNLKVSFRT